MTRLVRRRGASWSALGGAQSLVVGLLVAFAVIDMSAFGVTFVERAAYLGLYACVLLAFVVVLRTCPIDRRVWLFMGSGLLLLAAWLLPSLGQTNVYPEYVAGDLLSLALPLFLLPPALAGKTLLNRGRITVLGAGLVVAACLAPLLGADGNRYEPPSTLLIAGAWWGLLVVRGRGTRILLWGLVVALVLLCFGSGQRTALLVWLGCGSFVTWRLLRSQGARIAGLLVATLFVSTLAASTVRDQAIGLVAGHRITSVAGGEADDSLLARVEEAMDVSSTMRREAAPWNYVFGFGHGATYRPEASFLSRNVTAEGRVHNIHIGPAMIFFRYGLVGLSLYACLALVAVRSLLAARSGDAGIPAAGGFALATVAFLVEGLMFNVVVDPMFSVAVAGLLSAAFRSRTGVVAARSGAARGWDSPGLASRA